jgi:anti-anti-sigma regulatory factor
VRGRASDVYREALLVSLSVRAERQFVLTTDPRPSRHEVIQAVEAAVAKGGHRIVLDCSNWPDVDLLVLSALLRCAEECARSRAEFELINVRADISERIRTLGVAHRLRLTSLAD